MPTSNSNIRTAVAALRRAASIDDQHAITQTWLSRVLLLLSRRDEAVAAARRARELVTIQTSPIDSLFIDAVLAESQGEAATASEQYRELTERVPDDLMMRTELADFLKRQGENQPALAAYHEALGLDARYSRVQVDLCQIHVRLDDYPLAEQRARTALESFRAGGHRGGEAQALLCLGDAQRAQGGPVLAEAKQSIESARAIFESLGYEYGLSRAAFYLGLVTAAEKNFTGAAAFFEEALSRSRKVENRQTEAVALMNLGVTSELLGQRTQVLSYYQQSQEFYQKMGDERRAAEQDANIAGLLIEYGTDLKDVPRRIESARATLEKLGNIEFVVFLTELEAAGHVYAGRHTEGRRQLRAAFNRAKDRKPSTRVLTTTVRLADSLIATGEDEEARALLESAVATDAGPDNLEVAIALARAHVRLGDFEAARQRLQRVVTSIEASGQRSLEPPTYVALGELEDNRAAIGKRAAISRRPKHSGRRTWPTRQRSTRSVTSGLSTPATEKPRRRAKWWSRAWTRREK